MKAQFFSTLLFDQHISLVFAGVKGGRPKCRNKYVVEYPKIIAPTLGELSRQISIHSTLNALQELDNKLVGIGQACDEMVPTFQLLALLLSTENESIGQYNETYDAMTSMFRNIDLS